MWLCSSCCAESMRVDNCFWKERNLCHWTHYSSSKCWTVLFPSYSQIFWMSSTACPPVKLCNMDNVRVWPWNFNSLGSSVWNASIGLQWTLELILNMSHGFKAFYEILPLHWVRLQGMKGLPFINIKSQLWNWERSRSLSKHTYWAQVIHTVLCI